MNFVPLYVETEYTMLACPTKITDVIEKAKVCRYSTLAITDLNNMHGVLKFYRMCKENNIKPIIGLHITMKSEMSFYNSLLVYAKSSVGYKNLLILASRAKTKGDIDLDFLKKHSYDVLAVLPSDENEIIKLFREQSVEKARNILNEYKNACRDLYIGIDRQTDSIRMLTDELIAFGKANNVDSVAIHKCSYLSRNDFEAYQTLRCIDLGLNQYLYSEKETAQYFISEQEAMARFENYPELIAKTEEIASHCQAEIQFGKYRFPVFPDAKGKSFEYLSELCKFGLKKRLLSEKAADVEVYKSRLLHELGIIRQMGFADYFLIVFDYVKYAKKNGILVGPGRGSAPSSLVSYVLGITDLDPIRYDLLFERFLNPERISMPDIDIDFPDNRRDEVIQYVASKYGKERIAHISTFGTFGVRLAIRDVARVMKMNDVTVNEILKFVENPNQSMASIMENEQFKVLSDNNVQIRNLALIVQKLEGLPRHTSTHAAGIIMADDELVSYTALQPGLNEIYQTQYEASDLEQIGLVKMDLLGLRNLTIIDEVVSRVRKENPDFDINKVPLDDSYTYKMIASGDTDGVFQLESSGMRNVLIRLKTSEFMDIVYANALYRPGPMDIIPSFIKRKFREEPVEDLHPDLKEILGSTYGLIVFQEQIMLIAQKFAGYTLGMADVLRRAVSKKDATVLVTERERFVKNAMEKGYDEAVSNKVYDYIVKFANYGFNKSHSVAYSLIAYQMAYLKRRHYRHFMSVLMSNSIGSIGLIRNYISDCNKKKVEVRGPSVNYSEDSFAVKDGVIYYSLLGIQNLGALTLKNLLEERSKNGIYHTYDEFIARTKDILNKRVVESLILAGALDEFHIPRKTMVEEYDNSINLSSFAGIVQENLIERKFSDTEYSYEEASELERQMLGFNLKYSLFAKYQDYIVKHGLTEILNIKIGKNIRILFAIKNVKVIKTKNEEDMAFIGIYDDTDEMDGVLFPKIYARYKNDLVVNAIYLGEGNVEERNNKKQFVVSQLRNIK